MLKEFNIHIFNLSNKKHDYSFEIKNNFFSHFENSLIEEGRLVARLILDKRENIIEAKIKIKGSITLICDLSLEAFDFPMDISETILYKYGETEEELDDNVFVITKNTQTLNFAELIFELITVAVPMKKVHPDHDNGDEPLYYSLGSDQNDEEASEENNTIDPRWNALKGLKNKE